MKKGTPIRLISGEVGIVIALPKFQGAALRVATGNAVRYTTQPSKPKDLILVDIEELTKEENETLNYLYQHLLDEMGNDQEPF